MVFFLSSDTIEGKKLEVKVGMKMQIYDLTHDIHDKMPVFPGTEPPTIVEALTIEEHKNREKLLTMFSHTGTHMDAPAHMLLDGKTLDELPIEHYIGKGVVIDCRKVRNNEISLDLLKNYESKIDQADFVLFCTGWSIRWGEGSYFDEFPALTLEAAEWISQKNLKGVGTDVISIDLMSSEDFEIHQVLFKENLVVVENLREIDRLLDKDFIFSCYPLKIRDADGSPVRAVAIVENE
jgi:kynurenine formamidase